MKYVRHFSLLNQIKVSGLVSLGGTGRDDMQFASGDFRACWIYTWVAVKLPLASPQRFFYVKVDITKLTKISQCSSEKFVKEMCGVSVVSS